jgi:hypothetical protein
MKKQIIILIIGLIIGAVFAWLVKPCSSIIPNVSTSDTITIFQDTGTHSISYVPRIKKEIHTKYDTTIIYSIDTVYALLNDYNSIKYYNDSIVNDTSIFICYKARVYQNKLDSIQFNYKNKRTTTIITNNNVSDNGIYIGISGGMIYNNDITSILMISGAYKKGKFIYGVDIGRRSILGRINYRIKKIN